MLNILCLKKNANFYLDIRNFLTFVRNVFRATRAIKALENFRYFRSIFILKKTLEIDGNHSQASLMVKYAKKMLQEGWTIYDENGFEAKKIEGNG